MTHLLCFQSWLSVRGMHHVAMVSSQLTVSYVSVRYRDDCRGCTATHRLHRLCYALHPANPAGGMDQRMCAQAMDTACGRAGCSFVINTGARSCWWTLAVAHFVADGC